MRRKTATKTIPRPKGLQAMTPGLYAQVREAIRALGLASQPARTEA